MLKIIIFPVKSQSAVLDSITIKFSGKNRRNHMVKDESVEKITFVNVVHLSLEEKKKWQAWRGNHKSSQ